MESKWTGRPFGGKRGGMKVIASRWTILGRTSEKSHYRSFYRFSGSAKRSSIGLVRSLRGNEIGGDEKMPAPAAHKYRSRRRRNLWHDHRFDAWAYFLLTTDWENHQVPNVFECQRAIGLSTTRPYSYYMIYEAGDHTGRDSNYETLVVDQGCKLLACNLGARYYS